VQRKLPIYNIENISVLIPNKESIIKFENVIATINKLLKTVCEELLIIDRTKKLLLARLANLDVS
jgi:hypothetical protein